MPADSHTPTENTDARSYLREAVLHYRPAYPQVELSEAPICSSTDAAAILQPMIGERMCESIVTLALDARHRPIGVHEVSRGSVSEAAVKLADVFRYPLIAGAASMLIAHNHPSGDPEPSGDDIRFTEQLTQGATLLGLRLLDHLVITECRYSSFLDRGLLKSR